LNEPQARTEPSSAPKTQYPIFIKKPEGLEENSFLGILGRVFERLRATRIHRKGSFPFLVIELVPKVQQSPPPRFQRNLSTSSPKGLLSRELSTGLRDSSRELASTEVHQPSQSRISHEIPQLSHGGVEWRPRTEFFLSVERDSKEEVSLAGSREPTSEEKQDFVFLREEVRDLEVELAQYSSKRKFPFSFGVLAVASRDFTTFLRIRRLLFPSETDTPDPSEETTPSSPNLVQGEHSTVSPTSPSPGTTGELEGERR
jgi:hypothetical protein